MRTNFFSKYIALIIVLALPVTSAQGETESGKVLVFGGTGMIGYEIVKALKKQDRDVTVFVRASSNIEDLRKIDVPYVIGDVLEPETLRQALEQGAYETVISSISRSGSFGVFDGVTIHRTGNNNITATALLGGVQHLILMGTVGAGDSADTLSPRQRTSFKQIYQDKTAAENFLMASGLTYTIIRTGVILTDESTGMVQLTEDHTIRHAANIFDFAKETARCVGNSQCFNKVFHTHDPSIPPLTPEDLQKAYEDLASFEAERRGKNAD
jgi:nucleoside-diphosphate-sugar epimerase